MNTHTYMRTSIHLYRLPTGEELGGGGRREHDDPGRRIT